MEKELKSLIEKKTWVLVERPSGNNVVPGNGFSQSKAKSNENLEKQKAG